ncbi:MAG: PilW family protein [Mycobacterium sp.]
MPELIDRFQARLGAQGGFTLIELLVSILIGMVVLSGVLALTEVAARSASRTSDRAETTQRSRTAMTRIVQSLRSQVCPSATVPPIESGTQDANGVEQVTYYTDLQGLDATNPSPVFAPQRERLTFDPRNGGSIVLDTYRPTTTTPPFSWPATPTRSRTLATRVGTVGTTPFLRYYGFESATPPPLGVPLSTTTTVPVPANSIAKVVRVDVSFQTQPSSGNPDPGRDADMQSSVYLRNTDYTNQTGAGARPWGPRCD